MLSIGSSLSVIFTLGARVATGFSPLTGVASRAGARVARAAGRSLDPAVDSVDVVSGLASAMSSVENESA